MAKKVGHFTFRSETHKGKMKPTDTEETEMKMEVLWTKGSGRHWKRNGAWKGQPTMEQANEHLAKIAQAEGVDEMVAVKKIPTVKVTTARVSFVIQFEADSLVADSLLESYALEQFSEAYRPYWKAKAIGAGRVRLSFKG